MKVVHVLTIDIGGAAVACKRLNQAIINEGVDSDILVLDKKTSSDNISSYFNNKIYLYLWKIIRRVARKVWQLTLALKDDYYSFNRIGLPLYKKILVRQADIIHIHWINDGFVSLAEIEKLLLSGKKIVFTMHDMWNFTGGCHYTDECIKYTGDCLSCKYSSKESVKQQKIKKRIFSYKKNLRLVGCSNWIVSCAKVSKIISENGNEVRTIPNCIDFSIFRPRKNNILREKYNISSHKKIILFGAMNSLSDKRKGYEHIVKSLKLLDPEKFEIVVFGNKGNGDKKIGGFEPVYLGMKKEIELPDIYSSANVFLAPSMQENLANTVMESLACGTPVVAFDIGGMPDMIVHKTNGYLATPFDEKDFAVGINYVVDSIVYEESCFEFLQMNFGYSKVAKQYIELYNSLIL